MALPTQTSRVLPTGFKMPDGYKTVLALSAKPGLQVWMNSHKPPGQDGGGLIDTNTFENVYVRTKDVKKLKTWVGGAITGFIDPDVIADLDDQVNKNQAMTVWYPEFSCLNFYGAVTKWEPAGEWKEGEPPLVTVEYDFTNWDPNNHVEQKPVFVPATGT